MDQIESFEQPLIPGPYFESRGETYRCLLHEVEKLLGEGSISHRPSYRIVSRLFRSGFKSEEPTSRSVLFFCHF